MFSDINNWTIYMYTFPNGKRYIGATIHSLSNRQGTDWQRYKRCKLLYEAIQEYGPENIEQTILFEGLMENRIAGELESFFIEAYRTNANKYINPTYGYNQTDGGEGTTTKSDLPMPEERQEKIIELVRDICLENMELHLKDERHRTATEAQWEKRGPVPLQVKQENSKGKKVKPKKEQKKRNVPVVVHNEMTGKTLSFNSITGCARYLGYRINQVSCWLYGSCVPPVGYRFLKTEDVDPEAGWDIVEIVTTEENKPNFKAQPVIMHDPSNRESIRFDSLSALCHYLGVNYKRVSEWLGNVPAPYNLKFVLEENLPPDCEWNIRQIGPEEMETGDRKYNLKDYLEKNKKSTKTIVTHNPDTGESLRFKSLKEASVYYNVCQETVSRWLTGIQPPVNGMIVLEEKDVDPALGWNIKDIAVDVDSPRQRYFGRVIMHNAKTNETYAFTNIADAARCLEVMPETVSRWVAGIRRPPEGYLFIKEGDLNPDCTWDIKEVVSA